MEGQRRRTPARDEWRVFGQWSLVGVGASWATWTVLSYGWVIGVITCVGALMLANRVVPGRSAWGFVTGMGLVPVWVGWINRAEPAAALSPWVWIWSGAVTALIGLLAFIRPRRAA